MISVHHELSPHLLFISCFFFFFSYENKYVKFFKSKPDLPPGMDPSQAAQSKQQQQKIPGCSESDAAGLSKAAKRNMKRKEKKKQQQQGPDGDADVDQMSNAVENVSISEDGDSSNKTPAAAASGSVPSSDDPVDKAKKIKNLRKKLRQIEELQQKVDSGEIKEPTKDQLEKMARAQGLRDELEELEQDS